MSGFARLLNKVAIVTGSSSGIGREIATRYAQEGAKIICADVTPTGRSQQEASVTTHDLITQAGGDGMFVQTDVGDATAMENVVQAAVKQYGRLDM
jgi:NAD(P)-dependent dehydrogenase (short-subunit alcohol dehydrogenase family)